MWFYMLWHNASWSMSPITDVDEQFCIYSKLLSDCKFLINRIQAHDSTNNLHATARSLTFKRTHFLVLLTDQTFLLSIYQLPLTWKHFCSKRREQKSGYEGFLLYNYFVIFWMCDCSRGHFVTISRIKMVGYVTGFECNRVELAHC